MGVRSAIPRKTILRTRIIALLWIVGLCTASAWIIGVRGPAINTNVMALLPSSDLDPVVLRSVDRVQKNFGRHLPVLVGAPDFGGAKIAAGQVAARLKASGQFRKLRLNDYRDLVRHAVSFYLPQRFHLLGNDARAQLRAGDIAGFERRILKHYYAPQSTVNSALVDRDPLLLLPAFLEERTQQAAGKPEFREGYLTVRSQGRVYIALIGELAGTPFSVSVQRTLIPVLDRLRKTLPEKIPGAELLVAGVLPHAATGTQSGIDEMSTVGLGSMLAIAILLIGLFRSARPLLLTLATIGLGCVSGFAACLAIFGEVHLLTLIFGSSLVGISVDYSFHYFCERFRLQDDWSPRAARRHVLPGITLGLVTSAIGFAGLIFAPFPGMHGMAVFSIVGLCVAFGCVMLCYPPLTQSLARPRISWPLILVRRYSALWRREWSWLAYAVAGGLGIAAVAGCLNLTASDDVRLLQSPDRKVMAEEQQIRGLIGRLEFPF